MSWFYCSLVLALVGQCFADLSSEFDHFVALDPAQKMKLYWTVNQGGGGGEESISFAVEAATTGWVGLGFSSGTGRMKGADIVIGWVQADGTPHLTDRHGEGHFLPAKDDLQNYQLISGTEKDGKTTLKFRRKFDTCDKNDYKIEEGTVKVIFAHHDEDPISEDDIKKHSYRGSRSLLLLKFGKKKRPDPSWKTFELLMSNVSVPAIKTSYTCKPFRLPNFTGKNHIVRFDPVVQPGNEGFVHHLVVNECEGDFPDYVLNFTDNCLDRRNMPGEVLNCKRLGQIVAGWGVGGGPFVYPANAGFPVGGDGSGRVYILEIHYDNPDLLKDRLDNSGVRFYYTSNLRRYDAGTFTIGPGINTWMVIPPKQDNWTVIGHCRKECTQQTLESSILPGKGIMMFSAFLHTHLAGRGTWTQHIRDGVQLPDIARDNHYDFNFQEMQALHKEIHFKPGDEMIHTCVYNTLDRANVTYPIYVVLQPVVSDPFPWSWGGAGTSDEMCVNFITYYPRIKALVNCYSTNIVGPYKFLGKYFPILQNQSSRGFNPLRNISPKWTEEMVQDLKSFYDKEKKILPSCSRTTNNFEDQIRPDNLKDKIAINQSYVPPPSHCDVNSSSHDALRTSMVNILLFVLMSGVVSCWH